MAYNDPYDWRTMFRNRKAEPTELDKAIESALTDLSHYTAESDEYAAVNKQLKKLYELKRNEKPERVSRDTLIVAGAQLLGIMMIVGHERANVITSKATSMLPKHR